MKWFKSVNMSNKLLIVLGLLLIVAVMLAIFDAVQIVRRDEKLGEVIRSFHNRQEFVSNANNDVNRIRIINFSKWYGNESAEIKSVLLRMDMDKHLYISSFHSNMHEYIRLVEQDEVLTPDEKLLRLDMARDLLKVFEQYIDITVYLDLAVVDNDSDAMAEILLEAMPVGNELSAQMDKLLELVFDAKTNRIDAIIDDSGGNIIMTTIITSAIVVLVVILVLLFTVMNISKINEEAAGESAPKLMPTTYTPAMKPPIAPQTSQFHTTASIKKSEEVYAISDELKAIAARDIRKALVSLDVKPVDDSSVAAYTTAAHGLKTVLANIKKPELSACAAKLEHAGRDKDFETIASENKSFVEGLKTLADSFDPPQIQSASDVQASSGTPPELSHDVKKTLEKIISACESYDVKTLDTAMKELKSQSMPGDFSGIVSDLQQAQLSGDYEKVIEVASNVLNI